MEKAIASEIARIVLEGFTDQWGNRIESPVKTALSKYVNDNKEKIFAEITRKLTPEKIAEAMSERLLEVAKGIWGSSYNREQVITDLKDKVATEMAKKIAIDLKI